MSPVIVASEQMELSPEASAKISADMTPASAVNALLGARLDQDALKLLARLLPKRYAVGWLCQCARDQPLSAADKAGASMAEKWVRDPSEANRRDAFEFANAGGYKSLGSWFAASAGWSGGSLAPVSQTVPVPPADHLTALAVAAAINLMSALVADQFESRRAAFMQNAVGLLGAG